jgi:hypothetical protein
MFTLHFAVAIDFMFAESQQENDYVPTVITVGMALNTVGIDLCRR